MAHYLTRSLAARAAQKEGVLCFRTRLDPTHRPYWTWNSVSGPSKGPDATEWAKDKDYVAWIETAFRDSGRLPGYDSVLVISCRLDEIEPDERAHIEKQGWRIDPITPELFDMRSTGDTKGKSTIGRAKSKAESPVKTVWAIADEYASTLAAGEEIGKAGRALIIERCVEKGVNKSTASTQFYKWAKSKSA